MIKKVRIYDMDGTIVDSSHRYATKIVDGVERIDLDFWLDNLDKTSQDTLLPLAKQYQKDLLNPETYVIIATARTLRQDDNLFIIEKLGLPDYIISRKEGDTQSGTTLKIKGLQKFKNLKSFRNAFWTFFEDNTEYLKGVCDYFKINGVYVPSNQGH